VLHYGSLLGEYSLITLLPELQLGIFSFYNGAIQTDPFTINSLLHVHLVDLFIGVQPSVDSACHWCSHPDISQYHLPNINETSYLSPLHPISAYTGFYRHAVLGMFEVWDNGTETLMTRYGSLETRLQSLPSGLDFLGVPTDPAWSMFIQSVHVKFAALNGDQQCRHVTVHLLQHTIFERLSENSGSVQIVTKKLSSSAATALPSTSLVITLYCYITILITEWI